MKTTILIIIGLIIIITPFSIAIWNLIKSKPVTKDICYLCVITLIIGLPIMMIDRITEIPIPYIGIIKTATKQATLDAKEVSELKERILSQSATIDLVAQNATVAKKLSTEAKISYEDLSNKNEAADKELKKINDLNNFIITYLKALNDDAAAFEKLGTLSTDNNFPFHDISLSMYETIKLTHLHQTTISFTVTKLPKEFDLTKYNFTDFKKLLYNQHPKYHAYILDKIWDREDITKKEKILFLIEVRMTSNSLKAKNLAGILFAREYDDVSWDPFQYKPIDEKWEKIKDK